MSQEYFFIDANPGGEVICDMCNADYTDSPDCGGYLLGSWAVCPACALEVAKKTREHNESPPDYVCPDGQSFADFVRSHR